ncbi:MAG: Na+/H+ antiporter NhaA, partial [Pseudomonadales bacterium]|nr:Na+/H+ antiporter NhaA [Pseudomonadales bacterium]
ALANAGVSLGSVDMTAASAREIMLAVMLALVIGKPLGVVSVSWLLVRLRWCRLPSGLNWNGVMLVGLLAGVGFTMSIFIALLAFVDDNPLNAAKLGVLLGSCVSAVLGLAWGLLVRPRQIKS